MNVESEKYSDQCDVAAELEDRFRLEAIRVASLQSKVPADFDGESCTECGGEIAAGRLALGKWVCIECQVTIETQKKYWRK